MIFTRHISSLDHASKDALLRAQIDRASALEKQVAELEKLLAALMEENAALRAQLGKPPKTPDNSSMPPSQGRKPSAETKPDKKKGKRKSHPGAHRPLHPNPTHKLVVAARFCEHCQHDVSKEEQTNGLTYDHVEIPRIDPIVTQITLQTGVCPCCNKPFRAKAPEDMPPGSPFGPNLRAHAMYLRYTHCISFERLVRVFSNLYGLDISEGALVNMIKASRDAFARQVELIRKDLFSGDVMASDETTMRVGKKNWQLWVFHHAKSAVFKLKPSRGKDVVEEFLGDYRPDYWISDRYGSQIGWALKDQQFCLPHLIRDAQYVIEAGDEIFAPGFKKLLQYACALDQRKEHLKDSTLKAYDFKLNAKLDTLMALKPTSAEGRKFQTTIKGCRRHLFVFMTNREVSATNNGSEQAVRPATTFRKVTNCFRSEWGAEFYADIRSVMETARRRGVDALEGVRLTLFGEPLPMGP
jgi:transposase